MKKAMIILTASMAFSTFATGVSTTWVDFGTVGPDRYADGTAVEPGAEYRLLYLPNDKASLEDAVVCKTAHAVALTNGGAHCPSTVFQYPISSSDFVGGSFVTVLADDSVQSVVVIATQGSGGALSGQTLTADSSKPAVLAGDATAPKIESMAVKGNIIELVVSGLCVGTYSVESGSLSGEWTPTGAVFSVNDAKLLSQVKDWKVRLAKPSDGTSAQFYRVMAK